MKWPAYPSCKDSGVEWLGQVPEHWEVRAVKSLARIANGSTPKSEVADYWDGDIAWATPEDIGKVTSITIEDTRRHITQAGYQSCGTEIVPANSIILTTRAPIGNIAIAEKEMCTNQGCKSLVPFPTTASKYLYFQLLAFSDLLQSRGRGSTFLELSTSDLSSFPALLPPLGEQRAIAAFLDRETARLDTLIGKQARLIELSLEKRRALISHAVTRGLDADAPRKDSGVEWLGEVPEHWDVKRLNNCSSSLQTGPFGSQLHSHEYVSDGTPIINPSHLKDGLINPDFECTVDSETKARLMQHCLEDGDIVFARRGELGRCGLVTSAEVGWLCGTGSLRMRPTKACNSRYLLHLLSTSGVAEWLSLQSVGATMENLNTSILGRLPLVVPPLSEQRQIVAYLAAETATIDTLIAKARRAIELMREHRSALIAAAVTGKIDVRKA